LRPWLFPSFSALSKLLTAFRSPEASFLGIVFECPQYLRGLNFLELSLSILLVRYGLLGPFLILWVFPQKAGECPDDLLIDLCLWLSFGSALSWAAAEVFFFGRSPPRDLFPSSSCCPPDFLTNPLDNFSSSSDEVLMEPVSLGTPVVKFVFGSPPLGRHHSLDVYFELQLDLPPR